MDKPPLLQSKLLCFSLIYLLSAVYLSLSATKCILRPPFAAPPSSDLFSYPPSYGEHKHAIPTTRSSCNSPVFFSDYAVVFEKMQRASEDPRILGTRHLRYMQGIADSFGGNLSLEKRLSHFDQSEDGHEIPCGFFRPFPISTHDQMAMEKCSGVVVITAIFNDHDRIRQPRNVGSKTSDHVCFFMFADDATLRSLHSYKVISDDNMVGVWRVVRVSNEELYKNPAMSAVIPKHLPHRLFPNSKYSVWVDAKLQLVNDPLLLIDALLVEPGVDMALSRHPHFVHTMEEATATARWKKWWSVDGLRVQMETYCENGLQPWNSNKPYPTDVPDSALILRKHSAATNKFSCLLFNELEAFNHRDQLPFAFVRDKMNPKLKMNMFEVEVFERVVIEYRHNLKPAGKLKQGSSSPVLFRYEANNKGFGKCEGYFLKMFDEIHR